MPFDRRRRRRVPEQMDDDRVDPDELRRALRFIRRINAMLGYTGGMVKQVMCMLADVDRPAPSVLDVGCGSGDFLLALRTRCPAVCAIGLDRHHQTIQESRTHAPDVVTIVAGDALTLPFADDSIDVVTCGLFLHHLSDEAAVVAMREMARVARVGVVVSDLIRRRRAYAWISLMTVGASAMVRHDARASVAHAFDEAEFRALTVAAGWNGATRRVTFGHRMLIVWNKQSAGT
jgi:SAM-dependent methyltransferase